MRDIKFRAWIKPEKRMIHCVEVNPFYIGDCDRLHWKHDEIELMQFTGMCDETDDETEVFEGDIVEYRALNGDMFNTVVVYEVGMFILVSNRFNDGYSPLYDCSEADGRIIWVRGKVIGNIYEDKSKLE